MSRTVSSIRWRARRRVVSWPDRPDAFLWYPAPPPLAAPPCAAPTRLARSVSGFWIRQVLLVRSFPGHTLHEKGLQRQISDGPLVSSQERRAVAVPLINRGSTAGHPLVNRGFCISIGFNRTSFVRGSEDASNTVSSIRWKTRGKVVSWPDRPDGDPSYPAPPPLAAPPCAAPTRPARSVSVFWIRQVEKRSSVMFPMLWK